MSLPRLGHRARRRGDRAGRDPARRVPGPLPRARQRRERPHARPRGEAAHPEGHAGNADRAASAMYAADDRPAARKSRSARSPIRRTSRAAPPPRTSSRAAAHHDGVRGRRRRAPSTRRSSGAQRAISDLDRQRPRQPPQAPGRRLRRPLHRLGARNNGQQVVKLFRPNVKVLAVPGSSTARVAAAATSCSGWTPRTLRSSPTRPTTRSSTSCSARRGREADGQQHCYRSDRS